MRDDEHGGRWEATDIDLVRIEEQVANYVLDYSEAAFDGDLDAQSSIDPVWVWREAQSSGHSGGPVWYCGDDWCDTGDPAFAVSVVSGWDGVNDVGPKVHLNRTWILAAI